MIQMPQVPILAPAVEIAASVRRDDPYLIDYLLGWSGHKEPEPWGAAMSFALEVAHSYGLIVGESNPQLTGIGLGVVRILASGMETRQGGDVKQAPSQSDDSPTRQGDAQSQPLGNPLDTGDGK